jgi:hypothetical protein
MRGPRLLLAIAVATSAFSEETTQEVSSADGRCSMRVPAAWKVTKGGEKPGSLLRIEAVAAGFEDAVVCNVWLVEGQRDPLLQVYREHAEYERDPQRISVAVQMAPFPHLVFRYRADDSRERVECTSYSMVRRSGVNPQMNCPAEAWPALRDTFLAMAKSVKADLPEWPPHPPELKRQTKDGFAYLVHPSVRDANLKDLQSFLRGIRQKFEGLHGKVPADPENPPLVVVCNRIADAPLPESLKGTTAGAAVEPLTGRLFAVAAGSAEDRAACAMAATRLLFLQRYGWTEPYWMYVGEGRLAWSEEITGAAPPKVDTHLFEAFKAEHLTLAGLVDMERALKTPDPFTSDSAAYVMFFRHGPAKYRKAYRECREEMAETKNVWQAVTMHMLSFDQEEMKADMARWLAKSVEVAKAR